MPEEYILAIVVVVMGFITIRVLRSVNKGRKKGVDHTDVEGDGGDADFDFGDCDGDCGD